MTADVQHSTTAVVRPSGELDLVTAPRLVSEIATVLWRSPAATTLIVDLGDVAFMDSSGIKALLRARRLMTERRGQVALHGVRPSVSRLLNITGVHDLFPIEEDGPGAPLPEVEP